MKHLNQKLELNENSSDQSDMECSNDECSEIFIEKFKTGELNIKEICISCYGKNSPIISEHPLFHGGICLLCTERLKETIFVLGNDAKNICCIICSNPGLLVKCENIKCPRSYCQKCLDSYLGNYIVKEIMECSLWTCFFCSNEMCKYLLKPRFDWEEKLMTLFKTENPSVNGISFENFTEKRPITVLSLFDGISTGKLVLDMLGISVNKYYSSEIDEDAINVSKLQHKNIIYLGDVCKITESEIDSLDDIDLIIGGSPCNDLSLVNPLRKGLYDHTGSGRLFFDFFHILCIVKRRNPNVLYLFENVAAMSLRDKRVISSFLMHEPALIDAKYFSSQTRARYFWGNVPGLHSLPKFWNSEPNDEKEEILSDCILQDLGRKAVVNKIKTVTTQRNSLIQEKCSVMPVVMNEVPDVLGVSELEKIFGFPLHYTDTGNLGITKRRELLGQASSVPVIKAILQPLKFLFECK